MPKTLLIKAMARLGHHYWTQFDALFRPPKEHYITIELPWPQINPICQLAAGADAWCHFINHHYHQANNH